MIKNTIKFLDKISRYNYINKIKKVFKDLDILTKKIIKIGLSFCLYLHLLKKAMVLQEKTSFIQLKLKENLVSSFIKACLN